MTKSRHILILGGGFAGVYTALYLDKTVAHEQNVEVTIVSAENFVLFTPMLHEVAASDLNPTDIVNPLRQMFRHVRFVEAEAKHIDLQAHRVTVLYSANRKQRDLEYDYLVIAGGSEYNFFGNADPERHSVGMKTIADAMLLRNRIIGLLVPKCINQRRKLHFLLVDLLFGPFERGRVLVPARDKGFDRLNEHADAGETASLEGSPAQKSSEFKAKRLIGSRPITSVCNRKTRC
jgi:NADH dehydrogenase FAD-containing subunit